MDDRFAKWFLENNLLVRLKKAEADISLLQKLSTTGMGVTNGDLHNHNGGDGAQIDFYDLSSIDFPKTAFAPTIAGQTSAGTGTYTVQEGYYVSIGELKYVSIILAWTAHTGTGNMLISGLPFASGIAGSIPVTFHTSITLLAAGNKIYGTLGVSSTNITLFEVGSGAASQLPMDTSGQIRISGSYLS